MMGRGAPDVVFPSLIGGNSRFQFLTGVTRVRGEDLDLHRATVLNGGGQIVWQGRSLPTPDLEGPLC